MNVVCFYTDLGLPYQPLIERMCMSARINIPGARLTCLTPTPVRWMECFDHILEIESKTPVTRDNLCLVHSQAVAGYAQAIMEDTVFTGPDVVFRRPPPFGDWDIALQWRKRADQPVNNGVVLTRPGQNAFWVHYAHVCRALPEAVRGWWCDQLAYSLLTGVCHEAGETLTIDGSRVHLMEAAANCDVPEHAKPTAWALNYTGKRKGGEFKQIFSRKAA